MKKVLFLVEQIVALQAYSRKKRAPPLMAARVSLSKESLGSLRAAALNPYIPAVAVYPPQRIARFGRFLQSVLPPGSPKDERQTRLPRQKQVF